MEAHDYHVDAQGQAEVNTPCRPRFQDSYDNGVFVFAMKDWARTHDVRNRRIEAANDVFDSGGCPLDSSLYEEEYNRHMEKFVQRLRDIGAIPDDGPQGIT